MHRIERRVPRFLPWLLCLGFLFTGCRRQETSRPPAEERPSSTQQAAVVTPDALHPVTLPVLDALQESVRAQLENQHARTRALREQPTFDPAGLGDAYGLLGQLLLAYDFAEAAEPALRNAQRLLPTDARWPYYLGYGYQQRNTLDAAVEQYERSRSLNADDVPTRIHLAEVYRDLGRDEAAKDLLEETLRLDPRSAAVHFMLGQLADPGETADAIAHYEAVLRLQPDASVVHYPLGLAYRNQGNLERSRDHLARRGDTNVRLPDPLLQELDALKQGSEAMLLKGSRLMSRQRYPEAAEAFAQAVAEDPDNVDGYLNLGAALAQLGRISEAIEALHQTLRLDPANSKAHFNLGVLLGGRGDEAGALNHFQAAVEADPTHSNARYALSKLLWRHRRCRDALPHFAAFLAMAPDNVEARINQAICHAEVGDYAEARALLEAGIEALPEHPGLRDALVRILATSPDAAVRNGQRAVDIAERLAATFQRAETLESLAMAYAEMGRFSEAAQAQRGAMQAAQRQGLTSWTNHLKANLQRYEHDEPCRKPWEDVVFSK